MRLYLCNVTDTDTVCEYTTHYFRQAEKAKILKIKGHKILPPTGIDEEF